MRYSAWLRSLKYLSIAVTLAEAGCATFIDFDQVLDRYVGTKANRPPLSEKNHLISSRIEGKYRISEYDLDGLKRCRWRFVIDASSDEILTWNYPDSNAEDNCRHLLATQH
jgi:hypothetical protein